MSGLIIAVVDDMFFASKIRAVAEAVGAEISFPRTREALIEKARRTRPRLILVDLHNQKIDSRLLASELKADEGLRDIPLMGFFSHVQTELQRDALAAGFDRVLPRSQFSKNLPELLTGVFLGRPSVAAPRSWNNEGAATEGRPYKSSLGIHYPTGVGAITS